MIEKCFWDIDAHFTSFMHLFERICWLSEWTVKQLTNWIQCFWTEKTLPLRGSDNSDSLNHLTADLLHAHLFLVVVFIYCTYFLCTQIITATYISAVTLFFTPVLLVMLSLELELTEYNRGMLGQVCIFSLLFYIKFKAK